MFLVVVVISVTVIMYLPSPTLLECKHHRGKDLSLGDLVAGQKVPRSCLGPSCVGCLLAFSACFPRVGAYPAVWYCVFPFVFPNPDGVLKWAGCLGQQQSRGSSGGLRT